MKAEIYIYSSRVREELSGWTCIEVLNENIKITWDNGSTSKFQNTRLISVNK